MNIAKQNKSTKYCMMWYYIWANTSHSSTENECIPSGPSVLPTYNDDLYSGWHSYP